MQLRVTQVGRGGEARARPTDWCTHEKKSPVPWLRTVSKTSLTPELTFTSISPPSERPQPPRQLQVPQDHVQSRKLQLNWVPGGDGSSPVRYFTLQTRELPNGNWLTHSSAISHNYTSWEVDRWAPLPFLIPTIPQAAVPVALPKDYPRMTLTGSISVDFRHFIATCVPLQGSWKPCNKGSMQGVILNA